MAISQQSGFVDSASCDCIASADGRCAHVAAVLLLILDEKEQETTKRPDELPCTSKPCSWNAGKKRDNNPQVVLDTSYMLTAAQTAIDQRCNSALDFSLTQRFYSDC